MSDFIEVDSSNIASYRIQDGMLEINFHNSPKTYRYAVPESIADGFESATSKGSYFHRYVKQYEHQ